MQKQQKARQTNEKLKRALTRKRWSQQQLAEQINADVRSVKRWIQGDIPQPRYCQKLSSAFGMSVEELGLVPEESDTCVHLQQEDIPFHERIREMEAPAPTGHPGVISEQSEICIASLKTLQEHQVSLERQEDIEHENIPGEEREHHASNERGGIQSDDRLPMQQEKQRSQQLGLLWRRGIPALLILCLVLGSLLALLLVSRSNTSQEICTDTTYVVNVYPHNDLPVSLQANKWPGWLKSLNHRGWAQDYAPHQGDIVVLNQNTDGAGPEGAVGIVQDESALGTHLWQVRIRTAGWPGEKSFIEAGCNNMTDHTFGKIFDGYNGGVSYYYKVGVSR